MARLLIPQKFLVSVDLFSLFKIHLCAILKLLVLLFKERLRLIFSRQQSRGLESATSFAEELLVRSSVYVNR